MALLHVGERTHGDDEALGQSFEQGAGLPRVSGYLYSDAVGVAGGLGEDFDALTQARRPIGGRGGADADFAQGVDLMTGAGRHRHGDVIDAMNYRAHVFHRRDDRLRRRFDFRDLAGNFLRRLTGALRQLLDFSRHDGEPPPAFAGAGGLNRCVQRKQIGLARNARNQFDDFGDARRRPRQVGDFLSGFVGLVDGVQDQFGRRIGLLPDFLARSLEFGDRGRDRLNSGAGRFCPVLDKADAFVHGGERAVQFVDHAEQFGRLRVDDILRILHFPFNGVGQTQRLLAA